MEVTCDGAKDAENTRKHGISLFRAEDFDFDTAVYRIDDSEAYGEVRIQAIGWLDSLLYYLVFVESAAGIRSISLRKATKQERNDYAEEC